MVTLKDVAREAGVSIATASRAMRGTGGVKKETMDHVLVTAGLMGFKYLRKRGENVKTLKVEVETLRAENARLIFELSEATIRLARFEEGVEVAMLIAEIKRLRAYVKLLGGEP